MSCWRSASRSTTGAPSASSRSRSRTSPTRPPTRWRSAIAERTELAGLQLVWQAADAGEKAYQPIQDGPSPAIGVPFRLEDWKRLLDLLEERTDAAYADLWREWVVNDEQAPLIASAPVRPAPATTRSSALPAAWELPESIRDDLAAWEFDDADEAIAAADRSP